MLARRGLTLPHPAASARVFGFSLLQYVPVVFVIEEVFFRGALDSYVHRVGEGTGWGSAVFVSALWGLWHLPLSFPVVGWDGVPRERTATEGRAPLPAGRWWAATLDRPAASLAARVTIPPSSPTSAGWAALAGRSQSRRRRPLCSDP